MTQWRCYGGLFASFLGSQTDNMINHYILKEAQQTMCKEAVQEKRVDVIVMNSRSHSRLGQMILGSMANKIIHSSRIAVLVVAIK